MANIFYILAGSAEILRSSIDEAVYGKEFEVPSYNASKVRQDAVNLLKWASKKGNIALFQLYSSKITNYLNMVLTTAVQYSSSNH